MSYRTYPSVRYRYRVPTEPYRSVRYGIEAVPNLTEDSAGYLRSKYPRYTVVRPHYFTEHTIEGAFFFQESFKLSPNPNLNPDPNPDPCEA